MDQILVQLGGLLRGAIPTMVLFLLLYVAYRTLVHKPLLKVLDERRARTQGAVEKSKADIAAAEKKTAEYEQRLRQARIEISKANEERIARLQQMREAALTETRAVAEAKVKAARAELEKSAAAAKASLQANAEALASEILRVIVRVPERAGAR